MPNECQKPNFKWVRQAIFLLVLFFVIIVLGGCLSKKADKFEEKPNDRLKIAVSIIPQKYFVEKVGGDKVEVIYMVEKGASPHVYEPRPSQMKDILEAKAYISIGVSFEEVWLEKFQAANGNLKIFNQGQNIEKIKSSDHFHQEDLEKETNQGLDQGDDPHIWLSVKSAAAQADNIYQALKSLDPENEAYYLANLETFKDEIENLDREISKTLARASSKSFLVFHPAFAYLARDYDLEQIAIEIEGKEPSVKEMERILETARVKNLKTIFIEPQFGQQNAKTIADQINAKVVLIDPLALNWDENLKNIAKALADKD